MTFRRATIIFPTELETDAEVMQALEEDGVIEALDASRAHSVPGFFGDAVLGMCMVTVEDL